MNLLNLCFNTLFARNLAITLFLGIIFIAISLLFIQKILKVHFSKKNSFIYILTNFAYFVLGSFLGNYIYSYCLFFINSIVLSIYLLKIPKLNTFVYFSIKSVLVLNVQFFVFKIVSMISTDKSYHQIAELPVFGILFITLSAMIAYAIYSYLQHIKISKTLLFSMKNKSNLLIGVSVLNLIIVSLFSFLLFEMLSQNVSYILLLDLYFYFCMDHMIQLCNTFHLKQKIDNLKLCNKSILALYDETRAFKHDFHNIMQALGGYILTNDMEGLKKYYLEVSKDCKNTNNLSKLNPELINNPAIYNILANKYYIAHDHDIQINLDVMLDLNKLNVNIYELSRVLGILLDNAIEASKECSERNINISFRKDKYKQLLIIENTYNNKDISIEKIFDKDYTTKPHNTGLGLWEVKKILTRNSNLNLHTSKNDNYFSQQLEIYGT